MLTNSQPDDLDEAQEQVLNTNDLGTAASETVSTAAAPANQASAAANDDDDDEEEDEEEDDDENVLGDDDDEDEDEEEDDEARKASKCVLLHYVGYLITAVLSLINHLGTIYGSKLHTNL